MKTNSSWISKGAYSLLNRISIVFFGFVTIFFLVRIMTPEEVGTWALFVSVTAVLELLRNGLVQSPTISHYMSAQTEHEKGLVINASLRLHIILIVLSSIVVVIGAAPLSRFWNAPELEMMFYIYILRGFALIPCYHFEFIKQCHGDFKPIFIENVVRAAPFALYIMFLYFIGGHPSLSELAFLQFILGFISIFVGYYYAKKYTSFYRIKDKSVFNSLVKIGKYTVGTSISSMILKSTDSWMIGRMISTYGVALYNPALRISNLVEVPTLAIVNLVFPQVARKMSETGAAGVKDIYTKSVSLILAVTVPILIPIYLGAEIIITLLFGTDYLAAAPILRVTVFFMVILPFNRNFGIVMDALKRPKVNFYLLVCMGVINVILNYFLILKFGPIGAAYSTLISSLVIFIINQVILNHLFDINTLAVISKVPEWYKTGWSYLRSRLARQVN